MITCIAAILLFSQTVVPEVRSAADSVFKSANAAPEAHELAGIYKQAVFVDEFAHVAITDDLQIAFERHGNSGLVEANVGTLKVDGSKLEITWKHPEQHSNHPTVNTQLLLIEWGQALILVPTSRIHRFCINARENRDLVFDWYFVRKPASLKELVGQPTLPKTFRALAELPEITATALRVEKQTFAGSDNDSQVAEQTVTLDKGLADHVYLGMAFDCAKTNRRYVVTSVENQSCEIKSALTVGTKAAAPATRRGWTFQTAGTN